MKSWYTIRASASDPSIGEIAIHDEIGFWGVNADQFIRDLRGLGPVQSIKLSINSPGGDVFDGWAIYNALRMHPAAVHATVLGVAASMASVIAMAADTITMPIGAMLMIHNPVGMVYGESKDMQHMAGLLDQIKADIIAAYAKRTKMTTDEISALMDEETWMNGQQAFDRGFIDLCDPGLQAAAVAFDNARLSNMPRASTSTTATDPVEPTAPVEEGTITTTTEQTSTDPVEPTAPEVTPADPAPAETTTATATAAAGVAGESFVSRATAALRRLLPVAGAQDGELATLRAQVSALTGEREALSAQLTTAQSEIAALRPKAEERDALEAQLSDKRVLLAEIAEQHGLAPAAAEKLPAPQTTTTQNVLEQFEAITDPADRSKFYKEHKAELSAARIRAAA